MSDRRENSVLFSLRELRNIEEDRVKQEEDAEKSRIESERRAREDEVRQAKEADEAKIRAAEDAVRREREEKERAEREGHLRLQEAERRAQIEAATRLEQSRIEAEARAKVDGKQFPTGAVVGGVLALVLVAGGTMAYLVKQHNAEIATQQAAAAAQHDADRRAATAQAEADKRKFESEMNDLKVQMEKTSDAAEKAKLQARIAATAEGHAKHTSSSKGADVKTKGPKVNSKSTDPLGGLDL